MSDDDIQKHKSAVQLVRGRLQRALTDGHAWSVGIRDALAILDRLVPRPSPDQVCCGHNCSTNANPNLYTGHPCCDRAGEYNGYGSDGQMSFVCPKHCSCHD